MMLPRPAITTTMNVRKSGRLGRQISGCLTLVASALIVSIPLSSALTTSRSKLTQWIGHEMKTLLVATNSILMAKDSDSDEVPSMDWLTSSLSTSTGNDDSVTRHAYNDETISNLNSSPYLEEHIVDGDLGDVPIPTTGMSLSDEMEKAQKESFRTKLVPITGLGKGVKAVRILSSTMDGGYEAVRYLVRLTRKPDVANIASNDFVGMYHETVKEVGPSMSSHAVRDDYVMIDVPPFSENIFAEMKTLMGPNGYLSTILVTSQECIHYDDGPGVFSVRKADLSKWKKAFPSTAVVAYRMDIPRDCRDFVTQRLDGYGPWAMEELIDETGSIFKESGIPLSVKAWDPDLSRDILAGKRLPEEGEIELESIPQLDSIRANEEGKRVLAIYTPGRSFGSMTYVFPELQLCASGYSLPLEDSREEENYGMDSAGPALDHRGYITTSKAGMLRQVDSARKLVISYIDRFDIILTARGDPFYLEGDINERRRMLLEIMDQYEKLGNVYEQLGISGIL